MKLRFSNVLNLFIGLGMVTVAAAINVVTAGVATPVTGTIAASGLARFAAAFGNEVIGASSEFLGDGAQGIISSFIEEHKASQEFRAIATKISKSQAENSFSLSEDTIRTIVIQLNEAIAKENNEKSKKVKCNKRNVGQLVVKLSVNYIFESNIESYMEKSERYRNLREESPSQADIFVDIIEATRLFFLRKYFNNIEQDYQVAACVMSNSIIQHIDAVASDFEDNFSDLKSLTIFLRDQLLPRLAAQDGGKLNLQKITVSRYSPKYALCACPECGYNGVRIYTNEKTNITRCAACGAAYELLKNIEPELCAVIDSKVDIILDDLCRQNGIICDIAESTNLIKEQLKLQLTREYFEDCLKGQTEQIEARFEKLKLDEDERAKYIREYFAKELLPIINTTQDSILSALEKKTVEDRKMNAHLSQRLDSLGEQISSLYDYAKRQFGGLGAKTDLILEYVEKLCTKEYFEDMSNALGAELTKAITDETQRGYEHVAALNAASVAQIMASIDDIKKECSQGVTGFNYELLEQTLHNENVQLSGQIMGLQGLINSNHEESRAAFRAIIRSQDEMKAILLAKVGSKVGIEVNQQDFEKMYRGRIPSRYLFNEGLGGPFACPYCGTKEDRRLNDDQYCRCSICNQKFLAVNPFFPAEDFGREDDTLLATVDRIDTWREKHRAVFEPRVNNPGKYRVTIPDATVADGILIIPYKDSVGADIQTIIDTQFWQENASDSIVDVRNVKYLLLGYNINSIGGNAVLAFSQLYKLESIVFFDVDELGNNIDNLRVLGDCALEAFRQSLNGEKKIYGQRKRNPVKWELNT